MANAIIEIPALHLHVTAASNGLGRGRRLELNQDDDVVVITDAQTVWIVATAMLAWASVELEETNDEPPLPTMSEPGKLS